MTQETEFNESKFLAELKSVVDEIGGELSIKLNNNDMSYIVNYSRGGIPLKISLEALEAVCSTNGPGSLRETLLGATSPETMLNDKQNALICDLMNVSDAISKHTESKQERAGKLKDIVQKIMPENMELEKMESYIHLCEDMSTDPFGRFGNDDVFNTLFLTMKYDLLQYIANI
jgi:hypothetical protein